MNHVGRTDRINPARTREMVVPVVFRGITDTTCDLLTQRRRAAAVRRVWLVLVLSVSPSFRRHAAGMRLLGACIAHRVLSNIFTSSASSLRRSDLYKGDESIPRNRRSSPPALPTLIDTLCLPSVQPVHSAYKPCSTSRLKSCHALS